MSISMIPYGRLVDGKYGILLENVTGRPLSAVVEVFSVLPPVGSGDNFPGRLVFEIASQVLYVFQNDPAPNWFALRGIPADVGNVSGSPPTVPTPQTGFLFFDRDTEVIFVWDGAQWQPIGGRFAANFVQQSSISTGAPGPGGDTFSLGPTGASIITPELVEVFLDGVRQRPNPGGDYDVIGTNVVFPSPIGAGVRVFTRTVIADAIVQNAQVFESQFVSVGVGETTFSAGNPGLDPAGTFVFKDGILQAGGGFDYTHSQANTTILSIVKTAPNLARATTAQAHNAGVGNVVEIQGVLEPEFQGSFTIIGVPSSIEFEFNVPVSAPASATGDPIIFWAPPFVNDEIIFTTPMSGGETIVIRSFKSVVTAPSVGEANTASNLGTGVGVFSVKSGEDLRFRSLTAGPNTTVTNLGPEIQISATSGSLFEDRSGINTVNHSLAATESYIGVRNTSFVVTIDLSTVPSGTAGSGRRVVIQDESGGALLNNILISHAGRTFSGQPSPIQINTNYGSKTLVFDGTNWYIVAQMP
jgi:hypothetical protein